MHICIHNLIYFSRLLALSGCEQDITMLLAVKQSDACMQWAMKRARELFIALSCENGEIKNSWKLIHTRKYSLLFYYRLKSYAFRMNRLGLTVKILTRCLSLPRLLIRDRVNWIVCENVIDLEQAKQSNSFCKLTMIKNFSVQIDFNDTKKTALF
jgi:hypothetical protein